MKYLKIRKWEEWQSYRSDRGQPPWIKLHRALLRDAEWCALSDAEKGRLVSIWMLAADKKGTIPNDPKLIKKFCGLDKEPDLDLYTRLEFIDPDATVTSPRRQDDANVTPQRRLEETRQDALEVLAHLNKVTGKKFTNTANIEACLKRERATVDDCKLIIDYKVVEWKAKPEMLKFVNAKTPWIPAHFKDYLDQAKNHGPTGGGGYANY